MGTFGRGDFSKEMTSEGYHITFTIYNNNDNNNHLEFSGMVGAYWQGLNKGIKDMGIRGGPKKHVQIWYISMQDGRYKGCTKKSCRRGDFRTWGFWDVGILGRGDFGTWGFFPIK